MCISNLTCLFLVSTEEESGQHELQTEAGHEVWKGYPRLQVLNEGLA